MVADGAPDGDVPLVDQGAVKNLKYSTNTGADIEKGGGKVMLLCFVQYILVWR